jgi:hypothetical protein
MSKPLYLHLISDAGITKLRVDEPFVVVAVNVGAGLTGENFPALALLCPDPRAFVHGGILGLPYNRGLAVAGQTIQGFFDSILIATESNLTLAYRIVASDNVVE